MISAQECRDYQSSIGQKTRLEKIDELLRERIKYIYRFRSLPLNNTGIGRLSKYEKEVLKNRGFEIWEGRGGKCGKFDIIGW